MPIYKNLVSFTFTMLCFFLAQAMSINFNTLAKVLVFYGISCCLKFLLRVEKIVFSLRLYIVSNKFSSSTPAELLCEIIYLMKLYLKTGSSEGEFSS